MATFGVNRSASCPRLAGSFFHDEARRAAIRATAQRDALRTGLHRFEEIRVGKRLPVYPEASKVTLEDALRSGAVLWAVVDKASGEQRQQLAEAAEFVADVVLFGRVLQEGE